MNDPGLPSTKCQDVHLAVIAAVTNRERLRVGVDGLVIVLRCRAKLTPFGDELGAFFHATGTVPELSTPSKIEANFLSFNLLNACDKLTQGSPLSFAQQFYNRPPTPMVHFLLTISFTKLIAACQG